jgi:hypothetical protein
MESDNEMLVRRALFGKQVEQFLSSEVGRYMVARAEDQKSDALAAFKSCDVEDVQNVRALQNKVKLAESIVQWMAEAVSDGLAALNIIENRSEENE